MHVILMIFPFKDGCYRANPIISVLDVGAIPLFRLEIPLPPTPFFRNVDLSYVACNTSNLWRRPICCLYFAVPYQSHFILSLATVM